ncbi:hypothetical protein FRB90_012369 [Tulasnella sp. 427]|nr:hypothetical protein FRB90_012369 [Tulasnella sp. 427]
MSTPAPPNGTATRISSSTTLSTKGIASLPIEIIYTILDNLHPPEICILTLVSHHFHSYISSYWTHYHSLHPRPTLTLSHSSQHHWSPAQLALHTHSSDLAWAKRAGRAQELWRVGKVPPQPVVAFSERKVFVASAVKVVRLDLAVKVPPTRRRRSSTGEEAQASVSGVGYVPESSVARSPDARRRRTMITDVTGMIVPHSYSHANDDDKSTVCVGTADGRVLRLQINSSRSPTSAHHRYPNLDVQETARYEHPRSRITTLVQEAFHPPSASSSDLMASLSHHTATPNSRGLVSLYRVKSPWVPPQTLLLPGIPVCGLLSTSSGTPYIALGTRETTSTTGTTSHLAPTTHAGNKSTYTSSPGLSIHALLPSSLSPHPLAFLSPLTRASNNTRRKPPNAPYALAPPAPASPFGSSPNIILSGWYDSHVLVHDIRVPPSLPSSHSHSSLPTPLTPVLSFHDRFTDTPVYSLGAGGGSGSHVVAGMASHGVLEIFDARHPKRSWGLYSPGKTSASVYQLHVEGSRIWGLSDRLFCVDFGLDAGGEDVHPMAWLHADSARPTSR